MRKFILILLSIFTLFIFGCDNSISSESTLTPSPTIPEGNPEYRPEQLPEGNPSDKPEEPPKDPESNLILTSSVPQYSFLAPGHSIKLTLSEKNKKETPKEIEWINSNENVIAVKDSDNTSITIEGMEVGISTITAKDTATGHSVSYTAEVRDAEIIIVDNETRVDIPDLIQLEKNDSSRKYQFKTRILFWDSASSEIRQFVRDDISCSVAGSYSEFFKIETNNVFENGVTNHYITFTAKEKNTFEHNNNNNISVQLTTGDLGNGFRANSKVINLQSYGDRENTEFSIKEIKINGNPVSVNNINLSDNNQVTLEIIIDKKNKLTMYDFDKESINTKTGADKDGRVLQYSGSKTVSGQEVKGLPYYNHKGTDWIQLESTTKTDKEDTWKFNVSPNKTSRNRKVTLPFNGGDKKISISIYQPRSYNQHENVLWFEGVTPPPKEAYTPETNEPLYYVNEQTGSFTGKNSNFNGWFNVNKIMGSAGMSGSELGIYKDSSMCWAMAASNLIHWWANQNKDNLQALIDLKVKENDDQEGKNLGLYDFSYNYDKDLTKNEIEWQKQRKAKSAVGNTVRKVFIDSPSGGDPVIIFNWFFEKLDSQYEGFFESEFKDSKYNRGLGLLDGIPEFNGSTSNGIKNHIYHVEGAGNREDTNRFFNDVIKNGKAAMYLYRFGGSESNKHYVTAWAVIYDDYGDVIGVYTADNNMPGQTYFENAPSNSYLIKNRIAYRDDNSKPLIISAANPFNENAINTCKNDFNLLYSISSGKEKIAEYLRKEKAL